MNEPPNALTASPTTTTVLPRAPRPLTEKFTETETATVHLLIASLPLIFEEAFKDLPNESLKSTPADFWGVPLHPLQSADHDPRVSVILVKFLRARNMDVDEAQAMFVKTLHWRHDFKASETADEAFSDDILERPWLSSGKIKLDGPYRSYNVYGRKDNSAAIFSDLDRFMRWRVGRMKEALRSLDFLTIDSVTQVFDFDGLTMASRDANAKKAATAATKVFRDYYPETLAKKYFVNVPAYMAWIFWAAKPFVGATFAKFQMVGKGQDVVAKAMLTHVDRTELPKKYGGDAEGF